MQAQPANTASKVPESAWGSSILQDERQGGPERMQIWYSSSTQVESIWEVAFWGGAFLAQVEM
eukprot:COSAG02_NODE_3700_length_6367_cov_3.868379_2_plen_63_part_00